jgi:hypothetical protein
MPLDHQAGEAQVDFGYALAKVSGILIKISEKDRFYLSMWGIGWGIKNMQRKRGHIKSYNPLILLLASPTGFEPVLPA